jgi:hypothetical protein
MNRKNLIELIVTVAATTALCGCASAPTAQHTVDLRQEAGAVGIARDAWTECVEAAIPQFDNPETSSADVARAAMKRCTDQYTVMEQALVRTLAPSCGGDASCTRRALAKTQREATQAATDDVVTARVRVAGAQVLKCQ